jgi:hypothetical protein
MLRKSDETTPPVGGRARSRVNGRLSGPCQIGVRFCDWTPASTAAVADREDRGNEPGFTPSPSRADGHDSQRGGGA